MTQDAQVQNDYAAGTVLHELLTPLPAPSSNWTTKISCPKRWAEPHLGAIELTQFGITEEDATHVLIHLFQPDFFVAETSLTKTRPLCQLMSPLLFTSPRLK